MTVVYVGKRFAGILTAKTPTEFDDCAWEGLVSLPDENGTYTLELRPTPEHRTCHSKIPNGIGFFVDPERIQTVDDLQIALAEGFNPRIYRDRNGDNLLATKLIYPHLCQELLKNGVSVYEKNSHGESPLEVLKRLLKDSRGGTYFLQLRETLGIMFDYIQPEEAGAILEHIGESSLPV